MGCLPTGAVGLAASVDGSNRCTEFLDALFEDHVLSRAKSAEVLRELRARSSQ